MNPTVEEVVDDSLRPPTSDRSDGNGNQFSWPEVRAIETWSFVPSSIGLSRSIHRLMFYLRSQVFSRHESTISSHLEFLNSFKDHVRDRDAIRTVSSMVEKTNKLLTQFNVVKKQVVCLVPFVSTSG